MSSLIIRRNPNLLITPSFTTCLLYRGEEVSHLQAVHLPREVEGDSGAGGGAVGARAGQEQGARRGRRFRRGLEIVTG